MVEQDGREGEHSGIIRVGSDGVEDLTWGLVLPPAVFAEVVVEELIGVGLSEEVGGGAKGFDGEKLVLDGAVEGFDVGVPGGAGRAGAARS
jgi:hypothetical protein